MDTNQEIYDKWCRRQKDAGLPEPAYVVEAYTQKTIDMWKEVLKSEEA